MQFILNIINFLILYIIAIQISYFVLTSTFITNIKKMIKFIFFKSIDISNIALRTK